MARKEGEPLPVFEAERYGTAGCAKVTCPYKDCGRWFIVHIAGWFKPRKYKDWKGNTHTIVGRSCPYCMRVGTLPNRQSL